MPEPTDVNLDSLSKAVQRTADRLGRAGIEQPRRDARLLVAQAIGAAVAQTVARPERALSAPEQAALEALVVQRAARRPMAHIIGMREFWSLDFKVGADVLTPRPDSETLVEAVLATIADRTAALRLLDLGTGSGCLLLALLSELPAAHGIGIDASAPAAALARDNALGLGLDRRAAFSVGDWTSGLSGRFDLIISNPPYIATGDIDALMPEVGRYEPRMALEGGLDGLDAYRALIPGLAARLAPTGLIALEIGAHMGELVLEIARQRGLAILSRHRDLAGIDRCLLLRHDENYPSLEENAWNAGH